MESGMAGTAKAIIAKAGEEPLAAEGDSLVVREWTGSGPPYMHIHHADDEAWHVLEGRLRFKLADGELDAPAGTTVFMPAGVAHTYWEVEPSRYLMIMTPRLDRLIAALHAPGADVDALVARYETEIVN